MIIFKKMNLKSMNYLFMVLYTVNIMCDKQMLNVF